MNMARNLRKIEARDPSTSIPVLSSISHNAEEGSEVSSYPTR